MEEEGVEEVIQEEDTQEEVILLALQGEGVVSAHVPVPA